MESGNDALGFNCDYCVFGVKGVRSLDGIIAVHIIAVHTVIEHYDYDQ